MTMERGLEIPQLQEVNPLTRKSVRLRGVLRRSQGGMPVGSIIGMVCIGLIVLGAVFAPWLSNHAPDTIYRDAQLSAPDSRFWLGTDALGRDLASRILYGARYSLGLSLAATLISAIPGVLLGVISGYAGGWIDRVLSRLTDVWLSLPGLLLALLLIARIGPSLATTALALGLSGIPGMYRVLRAETRSTAKILYIEAAESIGASRLRIIFYHLLPNMSSTIIVMCTTRVGTYLMAASGLGFLGLGAQPPQPEWGALLASGKDYFQQAWWLGLFPALAITLTVLGFNLLGDGLRDTYARRGDT